MVYTCSLCGRRFQSNNPLKRVLCIPCLVEMSVVYTQDLILRAKEIPISLFNRVYAVSVFLQSAMKTLIKEKRYVHRKYRPRTNKRGSKKLL